MKKWGGRKEGEEGGRNEGESEELLSWREHGLKYSIHLRLSFHFNLVLGKPSVDWRGNIWGILHANTILYDLGVMPKSNLYRIPHLFICFHFTSPVWDWTIKQQGSCSCTGMYVPLKEDIFQWTLGMCSAKCYVSLCGRSWRCWWEGARSTHTLIQHPRCPLQVTELTYRYYIYKRL